MPEAQKKRGPGRPRKNPLGTQKELRREAHLKRLVAQETERARIERARREVQRAVREVFGERPWISKLIAELFISAAQRVSSASIDVANAELGEFLSDAFTKVLTEYASFDGLSNATSAPTTHVNVSSMISAAAMPNLHQFAEETLGDLGDLVDIDTEPDLPPMSDSEAEAMGFLPEA